MPRYLVQRTFPDGLQIPVDDEGAKVCLNVVDTNADSGVTWVHSYVSNDKSTTFCIYDGPSPRRSATRPSSTACRSTGSPRSGCSTPTSTVRSSSATHDPRHHRRGGPRRHGWAASAAATPEPLRATPETPQAVVTEHSATLAAQLAKARIATAKYATSLRAAKADGYQIITRMIPDMGYHFLNPAIQEFDVRKPMLLVYERTGRGWQLGALEWVFLQQPATPPLPGASYGSFGAACHYKDGTFVFAGAQDECAKRSPETGSAFNFWHPPLVTMHVWVWYHNPDGLYNGTNPLVRPFNRN